MSVAVRDSRYQDLQDEYMTCVAASVAASVAVSLAVSVALTNIG